MKTEHTKGEWSVDYEESTPNEHGVYDLPIAFDTNKINCVSVWLNGKYPTKEEESNAKLIAAAPELLEALKNCQIGIEKMIGWEEVNSQALKAIKKATS